MRSSAILWYPLGLTLLFILVGCEPGEVLGRVEGTVTFQGQPVAEACILFQNPAKGIYILALLDQEGRYRVEMDKGYGLPLGIYEVSLSPPPDKQTFGPEALPPTTSDPFANIPAKYRDPKTSGLTLEVKPGIVNRLDVDMR